MEIYAALIAFCLHYLWHLSQFPEIREDVRMRNSFILAAVVEFFVVLLLRDDGAAIRKCPSYPATIDPKIWMNQSRVPDYVKVLYYSKNMVERWLHVLNCYQGYV
ncbi:hypothetical protein FRC12_021969 [Ceratobasidium sp. 428]|nr:hypothetical protein FRC12_021969 [Ceratobasidium sp. 428]